MIIFLNGTSSSGKSSIAREILRQSNEPFLFFSIDHLINHFIDQKFVNNDSTPDDNHVLDQVAKKDWFFYQHKKDEKNQDIVTLNDGNKALQLHHDMIETIGLLAKKGYNIVIDEVIWQETTFVAYAKALIKTLPVYLFHVTCSMEAAEKREKERNDRYPGLARGIAQQMEGVLSVYDLELDTTDTNAESHAKNILTYVQEQPAPTAFKMACFKEGIFEQLYDAKQDQVVLENYRPEWKIEAEREISVLQKYLSQFSCIVEIQHIGSTAIPGIKAKPLIDIMIGVYDLEQARVIIPILESLEYSFWADNPKKDRFYFVKGLPPFGDKRSHHVHVFRVDSYEWLARQLFRDYLKSHQEEKILYETLKENLSRDFDVDREAYTNAKAIYIKGVVQKAIQALMTFEPLSTSHFPLLHRWFNKAHVQEYYSLRGWSLDEIADKFMPQLNEEKSKSVSGYIIYVADFPLGYIQKYALKDHAWTTLQESGEADPDLPREVIVHGGGIDFLIGEVDFIGKGITKIMLKEFINKQIWPYFAYCLSDPDLRNDASLRVLKNCGFKNHKIIKTKDDLGHAVSLQLMILDRENSLP